jgi:YfiH family protein
MSLRVDFGNRKNPNGTWEKDVWEKLRPRWKQVRGAAIAEVHRHAEEVGEVDALWTREPGIPLGVTTADCVPILLYRKDLKAVAAVHAGWQGTILRIVPKFFESLPEDLRTPSEWIAKMGPSIRACCYEFGDDLLERFRSEFSDMAPEAITPVPRHLDLIAILTHELATLGVEIESIDPQCTFCTRETNGDLRFFSYRQGDRNSRQYSILMK